MPRPAARTLLALTLTAFAAAALAACDSQDHDAVNRAARGTKQAVDKTVDAIHTAQDKTSEAADEINNGVKDVVKPK